MTLPESENWIATHGLSRRAALAGALAASAYAAAAQPVASTAITTPSDGLDAGMIRFPASAGLLMNAYRARPAGKRNLGTILVVQEVFGLHAWIQDICRRLARAGYYAIAPDLYQRQGDATKAPDMKTLFTTIVSQVPDAQVMADLDAAAAFAARDGGSDRRLAITGFCWGGRITWLYAAHNPKLRAGVAWYGRLTGQANPLQPANAIDLVARIDVPVLGLYGTRDRGIPVADVEAMNTALKTAGKPSSIRLFEADHGFLADYRPSYSEPASREAWAAALAWFATHLK
ncbi:dienelactone hydrolase family protein [Sandaracinobacteroides saxicola]|uniref:Dienelactone hydrolase family protein n=1 Tax=Sandaracinobacteroides saxicola TaxID=2759707 RepID=A0A7G5IL30_9SPHN|nr:dienelactone hydrolase family protein [Sandaracinobacteroides saxicola]QMW24072.1 dienelactone hydrolase family protein [Sandaracinobacteroides saxicola]